MTDETTLAEKLPVPRKFSGLFTSSSNELD